MQKPLDYSQEVKRFNSYSEFPGKINVPSFQRDLQEFHVNSMREHIRERYSKRKEPIFGALDIVKYKNVHYIVDGNHRFNAIKREYEENKLIVPFNCIFYTANSDQDLLDVFQARNKGLAVPDFILHPETKNISLLNEIQKHLAKIPLFNANSNRPNVNLTNFMNKFSESKLFNLISDLDDFKKCLALMNQFGYNDSKGSGLAESNITKCRDAGNYLGIYRQLPWFGDNYDLTEFRNLIDKNKYHVKVQSKSEEKPSVPVEAEWNR